MANNDGESSTTARQSNSIVSTMANNDGEPWKLDFIDRKKDIFEQLLRTRPYPGIALTTGGADNASPRTSNTKQSDLEHRKTDTLALDCMLVLLRALACRGISVTGWQPGSIQNFMLLAMKNIGINHTADMEAKGRLIKDCYGITTKEEWDKNAFILSHILLKAEGWKNLIRNNDVCRIKSGGIIYTHNTGKEFEDGPWFKVENSEPLQAEPVMVWDGLKSLQNLWDDCFKEYASDRGYGANKPTRTREVGLGPKIVLVIYRPRFSFPRTFQDIKTFQMRFPELRENKVWLQDYRYNIGAIVKGPNTTHPAIRIYNSASELPESDKDQDLLEKLKARNEWERVPWIGENIEPGAEFFLFYHYAALERNKPEKETCVEVANVFQEAAPSGRSGDPKIANNDQGRREQEALDRMLEIASPLHDLITVHPPVTNMAKSSRDKSGEGSRKRSLSDRSSERHRRQSSRDRSRERHRRQSSRDRSRERHRRQSSRDKSRERQRRPSSRDRSREYVHRRSPRSRDRKDTYRGQSPARMQHHSGPSNVSGRDDGYQSARDRGHHDRPDYRRYPSPEHRDHRDNFEYNGRYRSTRGFQGGSSYREQFPKAHYPHPSHYNDNGRNQARNDRQNVPSEGSSYNKDHASREFRESRGGNAPRPNTSHSGPGPRDNIPRKDAYIPPPGKFSYPGRHNPGLAASGHQENITKVTNDKDVPSSAKFYSDPMTQPRNTDKEIDEIYLNQYKHMLRFIETVHSPAFLVYQSPFQRETFVMAKKLGNPKINAWIDSGFSDKEKPEGESGEIKKLVESIAMVNQMDLEKYGEDYREIASLSAGFYQALCEAWEKPQNKN